jgi:predicted restriction endonuclease
MKKYNCREQASKITKLQLKYTKPTKEYQKLLFDIAPDYPKKYVNSWHKSVNNYFNGKPDSSSGPPTECILGILDAAKDLNKNINLIIQSTKKWKQNKKREKAIQEWLEKDNVFNIYPDDIEDNDLFEGVKKQVFVNIYERSLQARKDCIKEYGYECTICKFDFEKVYGKVGKNFIHVHHIKPLSEIDAKYKIDPIKDLRPVCPNCHAMLHTRKPVYSIIELQNIINKRNENED